MEVDYIKGADSSFIRLEFNVNDRCLVNPDHLTVMGDNLNLSLDRKWLGLETKKSKFKLRKSPKRTFLQEISLASEEYGEAIISCFYPGELERLSVNRQRVVFSLAALVFADKQYKFIEQADLDKLLGQQWMAVDGPALIVLKSFGTIIPVRVNGAINIRLDHIIAFEPQLVPKLVGMSYSERISGRKHHQRFVKFEGNGRLWCQSGHMGS